MTGPMAKPEREITAGLRRGALFRTLAPAPVARLAACATVLKLPRGKQVCRRGERCSGFYVVVSGRIMLRVGVSKEADKVIELVGPGGHIGLAAAVLGAPEMASAETLVDSLLLLVPRAALLKTVADNPAFALQLVAVLSRQVCGLISDIEAFSLRTGRERIANYLLQIAAANGPQSSPFALPAKKSVIASLLSLTPEYFSRTLHELIGAGAITVHGRQITVIDPILLRQREI